MKVARLWFVLSAASCLPHDLSLAPACLTDDDCRLGLVCHDRRCLVPPEACNNDGMRDERESCDDGNERDTDACTRSCQLARCGDGIRRLDIEVGQPGYEACDDGNSSNLDSCTNACVRAACADGYLRTDKTPEEIGGEACDDGNLIAGDGCNERCQLNRCGDGVLWPEAEACDDGNRDDADACTNNCEPAACGDGIVRLDRRPGEEGYEECDDGSNFGGECSGNCSLARCGDGVVRTDRSEADPDYEACDDGNEYEDDGCRNNCTQARCGDGILRNDLALRHPDYEQCDDGNDSNLDECTTECRQPICGDGLLDPYRERCDDGNRFDGDACSANCGRNVVRIEPGFDHICALTENGFVYCVGAAVFFNRANSSNFNVPMGQGWSTRNRRADHHVPVVRSVRAPIDATYPGMYEFPQGAVTDICSSLGTCYVRSEAPTGLFCEESGGYAGFQNTYRQLSNSPDWSNLRCHSNAFCAMDSERRVHCWRGHQITPIGSRYSNSRTINDLWINSVGRMMRSPDNILIEGALDVVVHAMSICVLHDDRRVSCGHQWMRAPEDKFEKIVPFGNQICGRLTTGGWFCFSEQRGRRDLCTLNDQDRCMTNTNLEVTDVYPNNYNNGMSWEYRALALVRTNPVVSPEWRYLYEGYQPHFSLQARSRQIVSPASMRSMMTGRLHACGVTNDGRGRCLGFVSPSIWTGSQCHAIQRGALDLSSPYQAIATRRAVSRLVLSPEKGRCNNVIEDSDSEVCDSTLRVLAIDEHGRADWITNEPSSLDALGLIRDAALGGEGGHDCVIRSNGAVLCRGLNDHGQVGASSLTAYVSEFRLIQGLPPVENVVVQPGRTCALSVDGGLWCWGDLPWADESPVPQRADLPAGVRAWAAHQETLTVSSGPICVVLDSNQVYCSTNLKNAGEALDSGWFNMPLPQQAAVVDLSLSDNRLCLIMAPQRTAYCQNHDGSYAEVGTGVARVVGTDTILKRAQDPDQLPMLEVDSLAIARVRQIVSNETTDCYIDDQSQVRCRGRLNNLVSGTNQCDPHFMVGW